MMKKVEIFDPAKCCSTGVCGPSVDPDLTRVASAVYSLEQKGVTGNAAQNVLINMSFKEVFNLSGGNKNYQSFKKGKQ